MPGDRFRELLVGYIDPGSGGVVLQLLLSMVFGAVFVFRRTLSGFWASLRGRKPAEFKEP